MTAMATQGLETLAKAVPATADAAQIAARELLEGSLAPDALMGSNGLILLGLVEALREAQLAFPEQMGLAGFDDLPWTGLVVPGITVIAQPTYDIGQAAIELLLQRVAHPAQPVRRVVLRGELQERGSSILRPG